LIFESYRLLALSAVANTFQKESGGRLFRRFVESGARARLAMEYNGGYRLATMGASDAIHWDYALSTNQVSLRFTADYNLTRYDTFDTSGISVAPSARFKWHDIPDVDMEELDYHHDHPFWNQGCPRHGFRTPH
jgi:hypothetical protein